MVMSYEGKIEERIFVFFSLSTSTPRELNNTGGAEVDAFFGMSTYDH